jgi:hypothetical protein
MIFTASAHPVGMWDNRHSGVRIAAFAVGLLGMLAFVGQMLQGRPAFASGTTGDEKPFKIPGLVDENALQHFQLQPFNVPVIHGNRVERIITIIVTLETKGDLNKTKVMAERYHLHDAFLRDIHGVASFRRADGRTIDPKVIKTRLLMISDRILGADIVENVLVHNIFDRPIP